MKNKKNYKIPSKYVKQAIDGEVLKLKLGDYNHFIFMSEKRYKDLINKIEGDNDE